MFIRPQGFASTVFWPSFSKLWENQTLIAQHRFSHTTPKLVIVQRLPGFCRRNRASPHMRQAREDAWPTITDSFPPILWHRRVFFCLTIPRDCCFIAASDVGAELSKGPPVRPQTRPGGTSGLVPRRVTDVGIRGASARRGWRGLERFWKASVGSVVGAIGW